MSRGQAKGCKFNSETDTEIFAHLIDRQLENGDDPFAALQAALAKVRGAWALAVLVDGHEDRILCAKNGSPLILGVGKDEGYVGSDIPALLPQTKEMIFLEEQCNAITYDDLVHDEVLKRSVLRSIEVIGEATKHLPPSFRGAHPEVPWRGMAGMRDRLIHAYFSVDWEIVWDVLTHEIPAQKPLIGSLLKRCDEEESTRE